MLPRAATQGEAGAGGQAAHVPCQQVWELLPTGHQTVYDYYICSASLINICLLDVLHNTTQTMLC